MNILCIFSVHFFCAFFLCISGAIGKNDIDNKSVENCVCILRNLSFACQEVEDASYLNRKSRTKTNDDKNGELQIKYHLLT